MLELGPHDSWERKNTSLYYIKDFMQRVIVVDVHNMLPKFNEKKYTAESGNDCSLLNVQTFLTIKTMEKFCNWAHIYCMFFFPFIKPESFILCDK